MTALVCNFNAAFAAFTRLGVLKSCLASASLMTRTSALELASYKIRVNSISPGMISTEGVSFPEAEEVTEKRLPGCPWGRVADADEVATVALFLASPAASYITGSDIIVDGGWTLYEHRGK